MGIENRIPHSLVLILYLIAKLSSKMAMIPDLFWMPLKQVTKTRAIHLAKPTNHIHDEELRQILTRR